MKKITGIAAAVTLTLVGGSTALATVWRVRQNYTDAGKGGYNNMIDYIEPAAAATNAVFGGTTADDTWNSWDVDTRSGSMGGYNYIKGVVVGSSGAEAEETLYDGTGSGNHIHICSLADNRQHSPWYGLPTSGPGYDQLLGGAHSAGINGPEEAKSYTVRITGLSAGNYLFYTYAHRLESEYSRTDVPAGYYLTLNGGTETYVPRTRSDVTSEGAADSGVMMSTTVGEDGLLTIAYTRYAGFTGPAFQLAEAPSGGTLLIVR